jgi:mannose-6-phosphate isomerase
MSWLPDGRLLADVIGAESEAWLGPQHVLKFGADTKLLFKLLDAGQRLPVHCHPHADWAKQHLNAKHGKAETWYILTNGEIHLGLKADLSFKELLDAVETQEIEPLLAKMHRFTVQAHQTVYVPPGMLHAIGEGILIVELQEPEDLSVLCEWKGFQIDGAKDGHLGLGYPMALTCVDLKTRTVEEMANLVTEPGAVGPVLTQEARHYFELERVVLSGKHSCKRGFAVMVVLEGELTLKTASGAREALKGGNTVVIPYIDGELELIGTADVLIARPPQCT